MRLYMVTEAPRAVLLDDLAKLVALDEHLNPERTDRIEAYRQAARELEAGAVEVHARHRMFRVANFSTSTYGVTEGTKDEILATLDRIGSDRNKNGHPDAREYARAIGVIERFGDGDVTVRGVVYRIVED